MRPLYSFHWLSVRPIRFFHVSRCTDQRQNHHVPVSFERIRYNGMPYSDACRAITSCECFIQSNNIVRCVYGTVTTLNIHTSLAAGTLNRPGFIKLKETPIQQYILNLFFKLSALLFQQNAISNNQFSDLRRFIGCCSRSFLRR